MGKGLMITNNHGWTIKQLQAHEKTIKKASMAKRVSVIMPQEKKFESQCFHLWSIWILAQKKCSNILDR